MKIRALLAGAALAVATASAAPSFAAQLAIFGNNNIGSLYGVGHIGRSSGEILTVGPHRDPCGPSQKLFSLSITANRRGTP